MSKLSKISKMIKKSKQKDYAITKKILKKMGLKNTKNNREDLEGEQLDIFNYHKLKMTAEAKYDYLRLMDNPIKDYSQNLIKWDKKNWKFQKKHGSVNNEEYDTFYCQGEWFRAIPKDSFSGKHQKKIMYGTLESARSYILINVSENINDLIDKKYPVIYAKHYGKPTFKKIKGTKFSRMQPLKSKCHTYCKKRENLLKRSYKISKELEVYILEHLEPYEDYTFLDNSEDNQTFIIGGLPAAKEIRFESFFYDFYEKQQPIELLEKIIKKATKKFFKQIR